MVGATPYQQKACATAHGVAGRAPISPVRCSGWKASFAVSGCFVRPSVARRRAGRPTMVRPQRIRRARVKKTCHKTPGSNVFSADASACALQWPHPPRVGAPTSF